MAGDQHCVFRGDDGCGGGSRKGPSTSGGEVGPAGHFFPSKVGKARLRLWLGIENECKSVKHALALLGKHVHIQ